MSAKPAAPAKKTTTLTGLDERTLLDDLVYERLYIWPPHPIQYGRWLAIVCRTEKDTEAILDALSKPEYGMIPKFTWYKTIIVPKGPWNRIIRELEAEEGFPSPDTYTETKLTHHAYLGRKLLKQIGPPGKKRGNQGWYRIFTNGTGTFIYSDMFIPLASVENNIRAMARILRKRVRRD